MDILFTGFTFVRLRISPLRIKLAASNFARQYLVLNRTGRSLAKPSLQAKDG